MKKKTLLLLSLGISFFILFALWTFLAKLGIFNKIDFDLTVKIQDKIPERADKIFVLMAFFASFQIIFLILLIITFFKKNLFMISSVILFLMAHFIELIGKIFLDHPGPPFMFYRHKSLLWFPDNYVVGPSYPSGHALRVFFLLIIFIYALLISKLKKWQKYCLITTGLIFCGGVVFGKILLGQHWLSDIVGGMLIGIGFGLISVATASQRERL